MAIDLDDLERKARAATPGPYLFSDGYLVGADIMAHDVCNPEQGTVFQGCDLPDAEFAVAASPDVVLAVIARIRQLEGAIHRVVHRVGRYDGDNWHAEELRIAEAVAEKGVTL